MLVQYSWAKYQFSTVHRAPSDSSGPSSMHREYIRATPSWRKGHPRYDCIFINTQPELAGMRLLGFSYFFFSFVHEDTYYPCALVQWFSVIGDEPDDETGFWMVEADVCDNGQPSLAIIHLDSIYRAAHLVPAYRSSTGYSQCTMHWTILKLSMSINMYHRPPRL